MVKAKRGELVALIQTRNTIAYYMSRGECHLLKKMRGSVEGVMLRTLVCFIERFVCIPSHALLVSNYFQAVEGVEDTTSEITELYEKKTGHLTPSQCEFFKTWEGWISAEEKEISKFRKELWTLGAEEREKKGRCFANMIISSSTTPTASTSKLSIHRFTYTLKRKEGGGTLLGGHISKGDPVTISSADVMALSHGFVLELTPDQLVVVC